MTTTSGACSLIPLMVRIKGWMIQRSWNTHALTSLKMHGMMIPYPSNLLCLIEKFDFVSNTPGPLAAGAAVFRARQFAVYQLTREQGAYEEPQVCMFDDMLML